MIRLDCHLPLLLASNLLAGLLGLLSATAQAAESAPTKAPSGIDFNRQIQPLFETHCSQCHGSKKQESALRLDQRSSLIQGGYHGPAIVPGRAAESLMIQLLEGKHAELPRMPRKGEPLSQAQIDLVRAWIDEGAIWPEDPGASSRKEAQPHWAFIAPTRPKIPSVQHASWARNPIDSFVLQRLESEKLEPAAEADPTTLLRRLSLDLIGLPPTPEQVDDFRADRSPQAYERQVARLLDSPHYGERWGRHWLDAARYADSDGFEKDKSRQIWAYRDYVIKALNSDLPYDQFIIEQLAGDLLPQATQDQRVATGFLRHSMINEEGGIDPEQFRMDAMFDRMDCIGKSILGLTIQCAQCHNHKFDPLSQEEYYRMFAFLNNDHESQEIVYSPTELQRVAELRRQMRELQDSLQKRLPDWTSRLDTWEQTVTRDRPAWETLPIEHVGENAQRYYPRPDHSWVAAGYAPTKMTATWTTTNSMPLIGAFCLDLLNDANLPCNGPGRSFKGTCALTEFKVEVANLANPSEKTQVKIAEATADFSNPTTPLESNFYDKSTNNRVTGSIQLAIDGNDNTAWGIDAGPGRRNQPRHAVFRPEQPVGYPQGSIITFRLTQNHGGWNSDDHMNNNLGRFRLSITAATNAAADPIPSRIRDLLAIPKGQRSAEQTAALFGYFCTTIPEGQQVRDQIEELWKQWPEGATTLTFQARANSRDTRVLRRGDWLKPDRPVTPAVPAFLHPLPEKAPVSRLTFAQWLVHPDSPTTARVAVNRIWQSYFGRGLVTSPEDFGRQSTPPSHPELLNWLACELMHPTLSTSATRDSPAQRPWSLKRLHYLIVTSATYRQSSHVSPALLDKDPQNRLLARGSRFRVEGEIIRDIALASSGLLNPHVGGPSIMPPAPEFLFLPPASYAPFPWKHETGPDKYRRALYTFRRRSTPYPMLQTFDVPNADSACVRRLRSNSPLQALVALNEPLFVECAQHLARLTLEHGGNTDESRLTYAFRRVLSRTPDPVESQELQALLRKQLQRLAEGWLNPAEIATGHPEVPRDLPPGSSPTQLAAYTTVSRVLLNLDETVTKE